MILKRTLAGQGIDVDSFIAQFRQVEASQRRLEGKGFALRDHVRGLLLSLLSNQRPWGPIARNLDQIKDILFDFDPERLQQADPDVLVSQICQIRCGNLAIAAQMQSLAANIDTLKRIAEDYGSVDAFVTSDSPFVIAKTLAEPGRYKLRQVGYALAMEYLKNVGICAVKPDTHLRRILSSGRLGYSQGYPSEEEAVRTTQDLAEEAECNPTYLDNLLWLFCAKDYGDICGASPRCSVCGFARMCNFPKSDRVESA